MLKRHSNRLVPMIILAAAISGILISGQSSADEPTRPEDEAPVEINPGQDRIEVIKRSYGRRIVKVVPAHGKPYCLEIRDPDPFDPLDPGSSMRTRCY